MNAQLVVEELAAKLQLDALEPDEDGLFTFLIDGSLSIFMRLAPDDEHVMFFAGLGSLDKENADIVCRALLESNNFWHGTGGFTLSLIPGTLNVLLTARERLVSLSESGVFDLFDRFIAATQVWQAKLPYLAEQSFGQQILDTLSLTEQDEPAMNHLGRFA